MAGRGRPFTQGTPKPANSGRKQGARNKRTIAAEAYPDALAHLTAVMTAKDDPLITPELKLRAAIGLAAYQRPKPAPSHTEAFVAVDGYEEPKTVEEARSPHPQAGGTFSERRDLGHGPRRADQWLTRLSRRQGS